MNIKTMTAAAVLAAVAWSAQAQSGDAILDLLVKKGVINQREANEVREQLDQEAIKSQEVFNKNKVNSWVDNLKWSGDFRLRGEFFDNEDQTGTSANDRWRFRYRLRLQLDAQMMEWTKVTLRLASGEAAPGDPLSTNQTFNDTFKKKPITIDAVYVTIQPPGWDWIKVLGGKMDNVAWQPKFGSPMVYDGDVTPEGLAEALQYSLGDKQQFTVFGNFGQYVLKESSSRYSDSYLLDFQAGLSAWFMGKDAKTARLKMMGAVGYYQTMNMAGVTPFGDHSNLGNSTNGTSYLADFQVLNLRGEVSYLLSERPFFGTPAKVILSGEYDMNLADDYKAVAGSDPDQTRGWTVQAQFGEAKKKGEWQIAYQYKYLEADAVWEAMTDSDWGYGGTDRKGHVIKAAYNLQDWWSLGAAAIMTDKISGRTGGHAMKGDGTEMLRLQLDTVVKF